MDHRSELPNLVNAASNPSPSKSETFDGSENETSSILRQNENIVPSRPLAPYNRKEYPMDGPKRGKVMIFNQIFEGRPNKRRGTEVDVKRLKITLPKLGFQPEDIKDWDDLTCDQINSKARDLQNDKDLEDCHCLVVVILTHGGENDYLLARDGKFHLYRFLEYFYPPQLKSMVGKPKIFIIQACRGEKEDEGTVIRCVSNNTEDQVDLHAENKTSLEYADFIILMSSHHGHKSLRNPTTGSWLIDEYCNVIEQCDINESSIIDILTKTNNAVSKRYSQKKGVKQISSFHSTLTKKLYFRLGANHVYRNTLALPPEQFATTKLIEISVPVPTNGKSQQGKENEDMDLIAKPAMERLLDLERELIRDTERDQERVRQRESMWMKEKEQDQNRQRKREATWNREREEERTRERKQEKIWDEEKESDRNMARKREKRWSAEIKKKRENLRKLSYATVKEPKILIIFSANGEDGSERI